MSTRKLIIILVLIGGFYGLVHWYNNFGYTNPEDIDPTTYAPMLRELRGKLAVLKSEPRNARGFHFMAEFGARAPKDTFPQTYSLLEKEHKAEEVSAGLNDGFIVLKVHNGIFNTTWECLKLNPNDVHVYQEGKVIKQEQLKNGWVYQRITMYTAD